MWDGVRSITQKATGCRCCQRGSPYTPSDSWIIYRTDERPKPQAKRSRTSLVSVGNALEPPFVDELFDHVFLKTAGGQCLAVVGGQVTMLQCDPEASEEQSWSYEPDQRQLRAYKGLCLGSPSPRADGARLSMVRCDIADKNQMWEYDGRIKQVKATFGKCLDTSAGQAQLRACSPGSESQSWELLNLKLTNLDEPGLEEELLEGGCPTYAPPPPLAPRP